MTKTTLFLVLFLVSCGSVSDENTGLLAPFPCGMVVQVSAGHNAGWHHVGTSLWAWDFQLPVGTPVWAVSSGVVTAMREDSSEGCPEARCMNMSNYVVVDHEDGTRSVYTHLDTNSVGPSVGDRVGQGALLARVGMTGWTTGPHLHFKVEQSTQNASVRSDSIHVSFDDIGDPAEGDVVIGGNCN